MNDATMKTGYTAQQEGCVITPEFRASFPYIFKPQKAMEEGKEPKYSVVMLFPKDADLTLMKQLAEKALVERFGDKMKDEKFVKSLRNPFRDQGEKQIEGYEAGAKFVTATATLKFRPGVYDQNRNDIVEEKDFYAGCYARAKIHCFAYPAPGKPDLGNRGVSFGLDMVQKTRDGDPLAGRAQSSGDFKPIASAEKASTGAGAKSVFDE